MKHHFRHSRNYLLGSIGTKALGFISIPFFTHFLTVQEFGMMSLYSTLVVFMSTLAGFGILGSIKRYYYENTNDFSGFLFSSIVLLSGLNIVLAVLLMLSGEAVSQWLDIPLEILYYAYVVAVLSMGLKIYQDLLQVQERSHIYILLEFGRDVLILGMSILFILLLNEEKYYGKIYADIAVYASLCIYAALKLSSWIQSILSWQHMKYALLFGLPVLPSMFSSFGLAFADRLMINSFTTPMEVGLYSFAFMIAAIVQIVILALSRAWQPLFYKMLNEKNIEALHRVFLFNTKIVLTVSLGIILFSTELIFLLADEKYLDTQQTIMYLVLGFDLFYFYTIYGHYTTYDKKTYYNSLFTAIAVVANIGLNYLLIPTYGYAAAAISTVVSYGILFILFYLYAKRSFSHLMIACIRVGSTVFLYVGIIFLWQWILSFQLPYFALLIGKLSLLVGLGLYYFGDLLQSYISSRRRL